MVRFGDGAVLFSNLASTDREKLTIRISYDGCRTWASSKLVYVGPSAYSDLAVTHDMEILCLYERGIEHPYEMLSLGRYSIE